MPVEKFLTVKEVAKKLRISQRSVMRYIKAKKFVASKMGQWRIKESDLDRFFKTNIKILLLIPTEQNLVLMNLRPLIHLIDLK